MGDHCFRDRRACGRGTRCHMGHYCVAFCKPRPRGSRNDTLARNTVLISYKRPFVEMLDDAEKDLQNGHYTHSEIDTMFTGVIEQTTGDGVNTDGDCDNDDIKKFGRETSTAWNAVSNADPNFREKAIQQVRNLKRKYEGLDESQICGQVDAGDPLAVFNLNTGHKFNLVLNYTIVSISNSKLLPDLISIIYHGQCLKAFWSSLLSAKQTWRSCCCFCVHLAQC